jgi:hypothetical protein
MYRLFCKAIRHAIRFLGVGTAPFEVEAVDSAPEIPRNDTVYLITDEGVPWSVAMKCPCGCGEVLFLSLLEGSPRWRVEQHRNGTVSVSPSIWRTTGCRSHFFLKEGLIAWCGPPGPSEAGLFR